uniref:FYVE-type domain-containing protein n=1 Tax=Globisporangium ultimum (strain ATCC 200006 / CBS 805.95 / DAOM BR144) TaxID=431595 RepID=K3XA96_GLOUD
MEPSSSRGSLMLGRVRGTSAAHTARLLPLPAGFFAHIERSAAENRALADEATRLRAAAVRTAKWSMSYEDGSSGWKLSSSKKHFRDTGIRTYCKKQPAAADGVEFKCLGKVGMVLARTMDAVYSDSSLDFRSNATFLLENCLDAAVLHVAARRDELEPHNYVGINWLALRSPGLFAKHRDICFLRSTGTMLDSDKNEIGYCVMHSLDVKECASLEASHGLVRTHVSGVFLFKQHADGRSTDVMWLGSSKMGAAASHSSASKLVAMVHETFTSYVTNLNKYVEAKFMAHQMMETSRVTSVSKKSSPRKYCYMCNKRFTLIRPRHACGLCGEEVCKDCGTSSRAKSFDCDKFASSTPKSGKGDAAPSVTTHFCKRCVHSARKELLNQPSSSTPSFFSTTHNIFLDFETSDATDDCCDRLSALSSNDSVRSLQKILSERSMKKLSNPSRSSASKASSDGATASTISSSASASSSSVPSYSGDFSSSHVPFSPLSIRAQRERRRSRLETDPSESYDVYDYGEDDDDEDAEVEPIDTNQNNVRHSSHSFNAYPADRRSSYENRDVDLATRLREMSAKAQELLDVTRRNSTLMSDTSSAPRTSELLPFQQLDQSIAEQADLLNVIGFVSTGRVYMENESGGVRVSESSDLSDSERFEVLT